MISSMSSTVTYRGISYELLQERVKKTVEPMDYRTIENAIKTLETAVLMCHKVDYEVDNSDPANIEKTAPHAVGYSQAAMRSVIADLKDILK